MEEAFELHTYLPDSLANTSEQDYLGFLWEAFEVNYKAQRYEFASLAFHLLYMSFVSFSIWQIKLARPKLFSNAMVGFSKESEGDLIACDNPFKFYDRLTERGIFRFLKLIDCTNEQVGKFARFVRSRNKIAHPTGTVFFNDQKAFADEITDMMLEVRKIEQHMKPVILEIYEKFLSESGDVQSREYSGDDHEISANLIHKYYLSPADISFCRSFSIERLESEPNFEGIEKLHMTFLSLYPEEGEDAIP